MRILNEWPEYADVAIYCGTIAQKQTRLYLDYAGSYLGKEFLVILDTYSRWLQVFPKAIARTSFSEITEGAVDCHKYLFLINETQFTSLKFKGDLKTNCNIFLF